MWFRKSRRRLLVLGSDGMLGKDVFDHYSEHPGTDVFGLTGKELRSGMLTKGYLKANEITHIVNCVAYTNTLGAETVDGKRESYEANSAFPLKVARLAKEVGAFLIHISTDWVYGFNDIRRDKIDRTELPNPKNTYGIHKALGEYFVLGTMDHKKCAVLRVSWLYGQHRNKSFVHKFLKNAFNRMFLYSDIDVTVNEISIPTSTKCVIECLDSVLNSKNMTGILHAVPKESDNDRMWSRYRWAVEILVSARELIREVPGYMNRYENIYDKLCIILAKLNTVENPSNSVYPVYTALKTDFKTRNARYYLKEFLKENFEKIFNEELLDGNLGK